MLSTLGENLSSDTRKAFQESEFSHEKNFFELTDCCYSHRKIQFNTSFKQTNVIALKSIIQQNESKHSCHIIMHVNLSFIKTHSMEILIKKFPGIIIGIVDVVITTYRVTFFTAFQEKL